MPFSPVHNALKLRGNGEGQMRLAANERALFTGFRNLVIKQFENETWHNQWRGFGKIVRAAYRPAGLLSTEMSKNVRFLAMVTAYGQLTRMMMTLDGGVSAYLTGTGCRLKAVICEGGVLSINRPRC